MKTLKGNYGTADLRIFGIVEYDIRKSVEGVGEQDAMIVTFVVCCRSGNVRAECTATSSVV